jgi:hypothetical protein
MMADFLTNVIARNLEAVDRLVPRVASRFEPTGGHPEALASPDVTGDGDRIYRIEEEVFLDPTAVHETPRIATPLRPAPTRRVRPAEVTPVALPSAREMSDPHPPATTEKVQPQVRPAEPAATPTAMPVTVASGGIPEARRQSDAPPAPHESIPSPPQSREEGVGRIVRIAQRDDSAPTPETVDEPRPAATMAEERHDVAALPARKLMTAMPRAHESGAAPSGRTPAAAAAEAGNDHVTPDNTSTAVELVAPTSASMTRGVVPVLQPMSPRSETVAFEPERVSERLTADAPRPVNATSATTDRRSTRRAELPRARHRRNVPEGTRAEPDTTVHVTIGRIEIKATPNAAPAKTTLTPAPSSGLEEYLRRRARGSGQ